MVTVSHRAHKELVELLEDAVQYWCASQAEEGELYSGETAWKIVGAYGEAKEVHMGLQSR